MNTVTPWVCRLYPEPNSRLYVRVQVWPTHKALLAYLNTETRGRSGQRGGHYGRRVQGFCARYASSAYRKGKSRRRSACVAEVNLWRGRLGIGVIAHELLHAAIAWADRIHIDCGVLNSPSGVTPTEERICYAHGELCRQFTLKGMRPGGVYTDADLVKAAK